jgi:xanthine dehydrogenase accessory factor
MEEVTTRHLKEPAVLVQVQRTEGSAPREAGAWMLVTGGCVEGTIGGGQLEFQAIAKARRLLAGEAGEAVQRHALGPSLGQCCGGVVHLGLRLLQPGEVSLPAGPRAPVALFGGGHVGRALVRVLGDLPFEVLWVDSRDEIFPGQVPANVRCEHSDPVQAAVAELPAQCRVLIMSFSHAEDLDVVAACLKRQHERADLSFIGLIGSKSKWGAFRHRLEARGFTAGELARVTCPIGVPGVAGKQPEVIAVAVAAQLLQLPFP